MVNLGALKKEVLVFRGFTWYCTNFLRIDFSVARGGFYSYYIHQGNKSDKDRKIVRKS